MLFFNQLYKFAATDTHQHLYLMIAWLVCNQNKNTWTSLARLGIVMHIVLFKVLIRACSPSEQLCFYKWQYIIFLLQCSLQSTANQNMESIHTLWGICLALLQSQRLERKLILPYDHHSSFESIEDTIGCHEIQFVFRLFHILPSKT